MSTSYSGINASDNTRLHVGAHHDNSTTNTTYNTTNYSPSRPPQRPRGLFSSWSASRERRKRSKAFLRAIEEKQQHRSEMLFRQGVDVDFVDERGFTALHLAAMVGYKVDFLLEQGYDVNATSEINGTPLCLAAFFGNLAEVRQILTANAKLNLCGSRMPPALHAACSRGHVEVASALMEAGTAVDAIGVWTPGYHWPFKDMDAPSHICESTPLLFAVKAKSADAARVLLARGANPNATVMYNPFKLPICKDHILAFARAEGHTEMIEILLKNGADPNATISFGLPGPAPLLIAAIQDKDFDVFKLLLVKGADANASDSNFSAMCYAVRMEGGQSVTFVSHLLNHGAHADGPSNAKEQRPICYAAIYGRLEVVQLLIESGADVTAGVEQQGRTPLHGAALQDRIRVAEYLLEKGAKVNSRDQNGQTPLHDAAMKGHLDVAKLLLQKGAHVPARDDYGKSPLDYAHASGHSAVVDLLTHPGLAAT